MNLQKILGLLGIVLAVVGAFVTIPYAAAILLILGLVVGTSVLAEHHVRVMVSALVLTGLANLFSTIPGVGSYLATIFESIGVLAAGAAFMIILRNLYARFKP
ncbi:MAG TPA: hypothetical protein VLD59_13930 [Steroidobacteraceae bacterium]|jgi:hypothetical protein|nr:hypothetical protein [Steroidobacteraceae bacterium]